MHSDESKLLELRSKPNEAQVKKAYQPFSLKKYGKVVCVTMGPSPGTGESGAVTLFMP